MSTVSINSRGATNWKRDFLVSYLLLGAAHEASHILAATWLGYPTKFASEQARGSDAVTVLREVFGLVFGRMASIPSMEHASEYDLSIVRHAGWLFSVFLLAVVFLCVSLQVTKKQKSSSFASILRQNATLQAALVTAMEAIATDLIGVSCLAGKKTAFLCGNFGVILLNDAWVNTPGDSGRRALDLLEKMVGITMMRGGE